MTQGREIVWSQYSKDIFDAYCSTSDNLMVSACPGSGKTTNIKYLWELDDKPTVYLVFNKHNQIEALSKLPQKEDSDVLTLNGLGHRVCMSNFGKVTLDNRKIYNVIKQKVKYTNKKKAFEYAGMLYKAVSMAKMYFVGSDMWASEFDAMCGVYDIDTYEGMYEHVVEVLYASDRETNVIDFADQIRLPAIYDLKMPQYVNVLGDEVQDFSPIQAKMIHNLQAQRYVLVGDRHQSIYGFRGAMSDSMDVLRDMFHCKVMPLSITYRCARKIVHEAKMIFDDIEPMPGAIDGVVRQGDADIVRYDNSVLVLCRANKPLVALAFDLLRRDIACHVRGRDIGDGIIKLIRQQKAYDIKALTKALEVWHDVESQKAIAKQNNNKLQSVNDKYETAMLFVSKYGVHDDVDDVINGVNQLFEQGKGVCLSTVHKAKGLEAMSCYILRSDMMPLRWKGQKPWELEQEKNVKYVAVTRAISELVYM